MVRSQPMRHLRYVESRVTDRKNLPRNESFKYYLKWFVLESHGELDLNQAQILLTNITDIISACDRTLKRKNLQHWNTIETGKPHSLG